MISTNPVKPFVRLTICTTQGAKRRLSACAEREAFRNNVLLAYMRQLAALLCDMKEENSELRLLLSDAQGRQAA